MTLGETEAKRRKAVEFLRRIGSEGDAEMDSREYADHKGAGIRENLNRRYRTMARGRTLSQVPVEWDNGNYYIEELENRSSITSSGGATATVSRR